MDGPTPMAHRHVPLESARHIRVMTIQPPTEDLNTICVTLKQIDLDDSSTRGAYNALSYVWGSGTPNIPIVCDGQRLLVTYNCHEALLELRRRQSHDVRHHPIWIDAICIDQGNEENSILERNSQVQQMGEVYAKARQVLIWLGPSGNSSTRFYKKLRFAVRSRALSSIFQTADIIGKGLIFPNIRSLILKNGKGNGPSGLREISATEMTKDEFLVMTEFAQNPWFKRVWTLQEVSFSRNAMVLWGRASVSLFSLVWYALVTVVLVPSLKLQCVPGLIDTLDNLIKRNATGLMVDYYKRSASTKALIRMVLLGSDVIHALDTAFLEQLEQHRATMEHDKIFGLFSSLSITGIDLPPPDYRKPTTAIFQETTVAWLKSRQTLSILLFVDPEDGMLPSWAFDWYANHSDKKSHSYSLATQLHLDLLYSFDRPRASAKSRVGSLMDYSTGRLPLRGVLIGSISSKLLFSKDNLVESMQKTDQWIDSLNNGTRDTGIHQAFLRCLEPALLFHASVCGIDATRLVNRLFPAQRRQLLHSWLMGTPTDWNTKYEEAKASLEDGTITFTKKLMQMAPFTLFALDSGHVGIGSADCVYGDVLYLLAGAPWPVVLRPAVECGIKSNTKWYRYVAAVRVDGLMRGESWPEDDAALERICLI